jgi:hypothetical protein
MDDYNTDTGKESQEEKESEAAPDTETFGGQEGGSGEPGQESL